MTGTRTDPAFLGEDHRDRFVRHRLRHHRTAGLLDERATLVAKLLGIGLDFLDDQLLHRRIIGEQVFEFLLFVPQFLQFLLDLDAFEPRQLAQADFQDVLGLPLGELESLHQCGLRLVGLADDADHLVDVQVDKHPPFEDVDAVVHLAKAMPGAPRDGVEAEIHPFAQHLAQRLLARPAVQADGHHVDRHRGFHAGVGQQHGHELGLVDL